MERYNEPEFLIKINNNDIHIWQKNIAPHIVDEKYMGTLFNMERSELVKILRWIKTKYFNIFHIDALIVDMERPPKIPGLRTGYLEIYAVIENFCKTIVSS